MSDAARTVASETADPGFASWYRAQVRAVVGLAIALTGDPVAGEDLAQEAFARALREWDRIQDPDAWVRRVVANLAASRWRRRGRRRIALQRLAARQRPSELPDSADPSFWAAVRSLPSPQALAVSLFYVEDRSVAEIARLLDRPEGTVTSLLHRARQRLAAILDEEDVG